MKSLLIPFLNSISTETPFESVEELLDASKIASHNIDCLNWPEEYPEKPAVSFKLLQTADGLLLKFDVKEVFTRATFTVDNQPVFKDSCVELFIDPSNDGSYYNFEFNALGTLLLGYGTSRHNREKATPEITKQVKRSASLGNTPFDKLLLHTPWQLNIMIPYSAFWKHASLNFKGQRLKANLQKCGDDLPKRHFLTWNPIDTPVPDYHRPEFFGVFDFR